MAGAEAELAVFPHQAAANDRILTRNAQSLAVGALDRAIFQQAMPALDVYGPVLRGVGGVAERDAAGLQVAAGHGPDRGAGRGLDPIAAFRQVPIRAVPEQEAFAGKVDVERAAAELRLLQDLMQQVSVDDDLLASSDQLVIVVIRVGSPLMRPGDGVDLIGIRPGLAGERPMIDLVGAGHHHACRGGRLEADGLVGQARGFDVHLFAIDPGADFDPITGPNLLDGLADGLPRRFGRAGVGVRGVRLLPGDVPRGGPGRKEPARMPIGTG